MATSEWIDAADCARMIRADLKRGFPGVKFSVRTDKYAGGASVRVSWTDGPRVCEVERIAKRREGADFDGMQDLKTYKTGLLSEEGGAVREVHYGADFVFCDRSFSAAFEARALYWLCCWLGADRAAAIPADWKGTVVRRVCCAMDAAGEVRDEHFSPLTASEDSAWFGKGGAR